MLLFGHLGLTIGISWLLERRIRIDYRLIALGSLLPDIIDKSFGFLIFSTGRALAHSVLFILLLFLLAFWKRSFLYLAFASFLHLLQDEMWKSSTFYFPFMELEIKETSDDYVAKALKSHFFPSKTLIFEIIGASILLLFVLFRLKGFEKLKIFFEKSD